MTKSPTTTNIIKLCFIFGSVSAERLWGGLRRAGQTQRRISNWVSHFLGSNMASTLVGERIGDSGKRLVEQISDSKMSEKYD